MKKGVTLWEILIALILVVAMDIMVRQTYMMETKKSVKRHIRLIRTVMNMLTHIIIMVKKLVHIIRMMMINVMVLQLDSLK